MILIRDREQLIVLPLIAILLPLIVMGGRVVSGIAIVLSIEWEASYNTIAINCSQYHCFHLTIFPFFKENRHIFKKVMFAKEVTRNQNSSEGSGDLAIHLSPIPYPLSPLPQVKE